jgi:hypothetical protein
MGGTFSTYGEKRLAYRVLVEKPLGRPRRRWENNIMMDLQGVGWGTCTAMILLSMWSSNGLLYNAVINFWVP